MPTALAIKKERKCACGCGARFLPYRKYQVYATNACRQRGFYRAFVEANGKTPQTARQEAEARRARRKKRRAK